MRNFQKMHGLAQRIAYFIPAIGLILVSWQGVTKAAAAPTAAVVQQKEYLPQQPELTDFEEDSVCGPSTELKWTKIYNKSTDEEAKYLIRIIDPTTEKVITSKELDANQCLLGQVPMLSLLLDKGTYYFQVIAYHESPEKITVQQRKRYRFRFDKYPGVEIVSDHAYTARLIEPEPELGIKTEKGVLLKWEPNLENHKWQIRIIKTRPNGAKLIATYCEEVLPRSEYQLMAGNFSSEDEDCQLDISIKSVENVTTPIRTYLYINNINCPPREPEIEKINNHVLRWEGFGDPDNDQTVYRLVIEKAFTETDTEPEKVTNKIVASFGKLDLIDQFERMASYKCYIEAQDPRGLKRRSQAAFLRMDMPPLKPVFEIELDRKKISRAKKIIVTHNNYDPQTRYQYYTRFFLTDGTMVPDGKSWYSEKPTLKRPGVKKKQQAEILLRHPGKQLEKIAVAVKASNTMGESAQDVCVFPKPAPGK